jgi:hydroxypyruvate isomerase
MDYRGARLAVNCSILLTELPLLERPAAARAAGFDAVEFWWPFASATPSDREVDAFVTAVGDAGVQLIGLNGFAGDMPAGERGVLSDPARVGEFRDNLAVLCDIGARLACPGFNLLYGNRRPGLEPAEQAQTAVENLAVAGPALAEFGGTILIEPLSGIPDYPLRTTADALAVVDAARAAGAGNTAFLLDLYHLAANGADPLEALVDRSGDVGHVQLADAPGRGAPGTGSLDVPGLVDAVVRARGDAWIALEYAAPGDPEPFAWLNARG